MAAVLSPNANRPVSESGRLMAVPVGGKDNIDGKYGSSPPTAGSPASNSSPPPQSSSSSSSSQLLAVLNDSSLDLRKEYDRLQTLKYWPCKFLSPEVASKNGFYYMGREDALKCYFCKVELSHWKEGDDVEADHGRWSPQCPLLLRKPVGNIPISRDECGLMESGLFKPAHSMYRTEANRLATYKFWPQSMRQVPQQLAEAGFYYSGVGDQTICYYCGGGLKDWEEDDDPWEQHAIWFSKCPYVINLKGEDFIRQVKARFAGTSVSPPLAAPLPASTQQMDTAGPQRPPAEDSVPSENKLCQICFDQDRNVCFVPCGHVVACIKCAMSLTHCPVCRQPYTKLVKLFFS